MFDNTYSSPEKQLKGTGISLEELSVTRRDFYYGTDGSRYFNSFVKRVEAIEARCSAKPSEHDLLDLLFVLVANVDMAYGHIKTFTAFSSKINNLEWIATGTVDAQLKQLRRTLGNIDIIFTSRHVAGGLIDTTDPEELEMEKRGSLMYLLEHSHSTSRRCMHKEVKEFLERETSC